MYSEKEMQQINDKLKTIKCPICGCSVLNAYNRRSQVISYQEDADGNLNPGLHSAIHCIRVHCAGCGYVMQFKENVFLSK